MITPASPARTDIPLFVSTEEAEKFGRGLRRVIAPDEFQTLVRTWLVAQRAAAEAVNLEAKIMLAFRCQTLREAVQAFLETNFTARHGVQGDPATLIEQIDGHETAAVEPHQLAGAT